MSTYVIHILLTWSIFEGIVNSVVRINTSTLVIVW